MSGGETLAGLLDGGEHASGEAIASPTRSSLRRGGRLLANLLLVVGALLLVWGFWVWRWGDPITGYYERIQQSRLGSAYEHLERRYVAASLPVRSAAPRLYRADFMRRLAASAARYRSALRPGDPVGQLRIPRLGLSDVVVNGTADDELRRGPGRDLRTYLPGQGQLVYVAGHRTTFGAPFAHIDALRPGDSITFVLPYARFRYAVTGHRIVPADALQMLRSQGREVLRLQACHPRFFATERYLVDARPVSITLFGRGGASQTLVLG